MYLGEEMAGLGEGDVALNLQPGVQKFVGDGVKFAVANVFELTGKFSFTKLPNGKVQVLVTAATPAAGQTAKPGAGAMSLSCLPVRAGSVSTAAAIVAKFRRAMSVTIIRPSGPRPTYRIRSMGFSSGVGPV